MMQSKIVEDSKIVGEILPVTATGAVVYSAAIPLSADVGRHFIGYVMGGVRVIPI